MYVLGIKYWWHDTGAALIHDDGSTLKIVAINEARLSREKHSYRYPLLAIDYCLSAMGLSDLGQIDMVCIDRANQWPEPYSQIGVAQIERFRRDPNYKRVERTHGIDPAGDYPIEQSIRFPERSCHLVEHLDAHAASAFYVSGLASAAVLVVDGGGAGLYVGDGRHLWAIDKYGYDGPLVLNGRVMADGFRSMRNTGVMFSAVTQTLGFGAFGAGQTMAVAAYHDTVPRLDCLQLAEDRYRGAIVDYRRIAIAPGFTWSTWDERVNAARAAQEALEADMIHLSRLAASKTKRSSLCLAGGVALSCVANRRILDDGRFERLFIQPAASDEGIALGCALYGYHMIAEREQRHVMDTAYLGAPLDPARVEATIRHWNVPYRPADDAEVARLLSEGRIVARVFGASEFGPRALGNRSILADPRDPAMKDRINRDIKHREPFRPFAPSCVAERAHEFFDMPVEAPFMILAGAVRPSARALIPAVIHVDGSSRVQTVRRDQNPRYHGLLEAFGALTGVPVLLNTSFNDNDEPIVESPEDALLSFLKTGVDHLYIEGFLVDRPGDAAELRGRLERAIRAAIDERTGALIDRFCDRRRYDLFARMVAEAVA